MGACHCSAVSTERDADCAPAAALEKQHKNDKIQGQGQYGKHSQAVSGAFINSKTTVHSSDPHLINILMKAKDKNEHCQENPAKQQHERMDSKPHAFGQSDNPHVTEYQGNNATVERRHPRPASRAASSTVVPHPDLARVDSTATGRQSADPFCEANTGSQCSISVQFHSHAIRPLLVRRESDNTALSHDIKVRSKVGGGTQTNSLDSSHPHCSSDIENNMNVNDVDEWESSDDETEDERRKRLASGITKKINPVIRSPIRRNGRRLNRKKYKERSLFGNTAAALSPASASAVFPRTALDFLRSTNYSATNTYLSPSVQSPVSNPLSPFATSHGMHILAQSPQSIQFEPQTSPNNRTIIINDGVVGSNVVDQQPCGPSLSNENSCSGLTPQPIVVISNEIVLADAPNNPMGTTLHIPGQFISGNAANQFETDPHSRTPSAACTPCDSPMHASTPSHLLAHRRSLIANMPNAPRLAAAPNSGYVSTLASRANSRASSPIGSRTSSPINLDYAFAANGSPSAGQSNGGSQRRLSLQAHYISRTGKLHGTGLLPPARLSGRSAAARSPHSQNHSHTKSVPMTVRMLSPEQIAKLAELQANNELTAQ